MKNMAQAPARQMTKAELSFKKMQEKMASVWCGYNKWDDLL